MKKLNLYIAIILTFYSFYAKGQYYTPAQINTITTNRTAAEGNMYLDTTVNQDFYIGLTHGILAKIGDTLDESIDTVYVNGDEIIVVEGDDTLIARLSKHDIGDVKNGFQTTDHNGWYLLNGRAIASLSSNAQVAAASLGFGANLPDADNRVLKHPTGAETLGSTGGQASTALIQANIPNYNLPTATSTSAGNHNHTGTTNTTGNHNHTGTTNTTGNHNHTGNTNTAGSHRHTVSFRSQSDRVRNGVDQVRTFLQAGGVTNTNTTGDHSHTLTTNTTGNHNHTLTIDNNGNHNHTLTINNNGVHNHNVTVSSGGSGTSFERYQPYIVVNTFIYLGQ